MAKRLKKFFIPATVQDKLSLFRFLFDTQTLDINSSLALLNLIHRDLSSSKHEAALYRQYAQSIEEMEFYMSDVLDEVVESWKKHRK